jgi:hypothetical protein
LTNEELIELVARAIIHEAFAALTAQRRSIGDTANQFGVTELLVKPQQSEV